MAINTSALNSTLQSRVNALDAATDTKEVLLLSKALEAAAGSTSVSDILSEGVVQVNNVNSEGSAQVANVQNEGATQRASVGAVLGDYTLTTGFKTVGGTSIVGSGDIATLPSQSGASGKVLKSDGTSASWGTDEVGKVLQVKQTQFTSEPQFSPSNNWQTISGFSVDITPSSASSKILVTANIGYGGNAPVSTIRLTRNGTNTHADGWILAGYSNSTFAEIVSGSHLDSPNTTSQVTYQLLIRTHGGNWSFINRDESNTYPATASTITVMEIGA
jgi:hypothetical protein